MKDLIKLNEIFYSLLMQDVLSIHIRRGGINKGQSHAQWLSTVSESPNVISMSFVPIASLLSGVPGSGFLSHAINLYLRCEYMHKLLIYHSETFSITSCCLPIYIIASNKLGIL